MDPNIPVDRQDVGNEPINDNDDQDLSTDCKKAKEVLIPFYRCAGSQCWNLVPAPEDMCQECTLKKLTPQQ